MSETKTFNCPSCGASLTTTGKDAELKCPYCGSTVIVPPELRQARDPDDDSDEEAATNVFDAATPNLKPMMTLIEGIVGVTFIVPLLITVVTLVMVGVIMFVVFGIIFPIVFR